MNISIFGLGYVGTVSAVCLAKQGHRVIGVDTNPVKVELINQGTTPIVEPGVDSLLQQALNERRLSATKNSRRRPADGPPTYLRRHAEQSEWQPEPRSGDAGGEQTDRPRSEEH